MNSIAGKRIALYGGAGFVGHHLAIGLKTMGADVHVVDSLQVNSLGAIASEVDPPYDRERYLSIVHERLNLLRAADIPVYVQDLRDYHALTRIFNQIEPQVIIHLAAVAHAGQSNRDPFNTYDHSLRTLENALDNGRQRVEQFIYFSSSMVYGDFQSDSITEDHPQNPIGIYGALKLAGEKIVIGYHQVFGLPYTIIRPSALYGPRCVSRRVGQIFIESALDGRPIRVNGDGSDRLDFTYIDDLIHGVARVIEKPEARNQTFNLTFGEGRSIQSLIDCIRESIDIPRVEYVERDRLMPVRGTLCVDKARELLNYSPQHSIERGVPLYIEWYRQFLAR